MRQAACDAFLLHFCTSSGRISMPSFKQLIAQPMTKLFAMFSSVRSASVLVRVEQRHRKRRLRRRLKAAALDALRTLHCRLRLPLRRLQIAKPPCRVRHTHVALAHDAVHIMRAHIARGPQVVCDRVEGVAVGCTCGWRRGELARLALHKVQQCCGRDASSARQEQCIDSYAPLKAFVKGCNAAEKLQVGRAAQKACSVAWQVCTSAVQRTDMRAISSLTVLPASTKASIAFAGSFNRSKSRPLRYLYGCCTFIGGRLAAQVIHNFGCCGRPADLHAAF